MPVHTCIDGSSASAGSVKLVMNIVVNIDPIDLGQKHASSEVRYFQKCPQIGGFLAQKIQMCRL